MPCEAASRTAHTAHTAPAGNLTLVRVICAVVFQVGFHSNKLVTKVKVEKRVNEIINRLNRTRQELYPDLAAERENYDRGIRVARKSELQVCAAAVLGSALLLC